MKRLTVFSTSVLFVGLLAFVGTTIAKKSKDKQYAPTGFTLFQTEAITLPGRDPMQVGVWVRIANLRGEWKHIIQRFRQDGTVSIQENVGTERGVYKILKRDKANNAGQSEGGTLELLSAWAPPDLSWYSTQSMRSTPGFVREERILAYTAFVIRSEDHGPGAWTERYYVPQLGPTWVKMVDYRPDDGYMIVEPVSVELREPDPSFIKAPGLPIGHTLMRQKIDDLKRKGKTDAAEGWKQQLMEHERANR